MAGRLEAVRCCDTHAGVPAVLVCLSQKPLQFTILQFLDRPQVALTTGVCRRFHGFDELWQPNLSFSRGKERVFRWPFCQCLICASTRTNARLEDVCYARDAISGQTRSWRALEETKHAWQAARAPKPRASENLLGAVLGVSNTPRLRISLNRPRGTIYRREIAGLVWRELTALSR